MRTMDFSHYSQYAFWGNVEYTTNKAAMLARNALAKEMRVKGHRVVKRSLVGQLCKYSGLGQPDGRVGTVYYLDVFPIVGVNNEI